MSERGSTLSVAVTKSRLVVREGSQSPPDCPQISNAPIFTINHYLTKERQEAEEQENE